VPRFPAERPIPERPHWACEALSRSTARRDLGAKRAIYERAGVPWYWVLDVANRELTVFRLTGEGYVVHATAGDDEPARLPPFDEVAIDLRDAFPPDDPPAE
jgi:Uma2 family endonuclease